jgi:hypothetical protein
MSTAHLSVRLTAQTQCAHGTAFVLSRCHGFRSDDRLPGLLTRASGYPGRTC